MNNYSMTNYTWDNAKMQLFDRHKGSLTNRAACAGELILNTELAKLKMLGVAGGTALAVDTFAGSKVALNGAKKLASKAGDKALETVGKIAKENAKAGNIINKLSSGIDKAATYADDLAIKIKNSNVADKAAKMADKVANNGTVKKVATKVAEAATKVKNSNFVKTLSKNKVGIIIAAGIVAGAAVMIDWAQKNGDIEQKYEDKAKLKG